MQSKDLSGGGGYMGLNIPSIPLKLSSPKNLQNICSVGGKVFANFEETPELTTSPTVEGGCLDKL